MKEKLNRLIVIPGLGDHSRISNYYTQFFLSKWEMHGINASLYLFDWRDGFPISEKVKKLTNFLEESFGDKERISLMGFSAGGSAAINTFLERPDLIYKTVSVVGRLREGNHRIRSLNRWSKIVSFMGSIDLVEKRLNGAENHLSRIMTVSARYGDEVVPGDTVYVDGAVNISVPTAGHVVTEIACLTFFKRPIIDFLSK